MRVPGYEKQISPQVPTVRSGVQIPEGAAGVTADLSPLQRGVETFALGLGKMQEQREQFELAEAVNDFRRKNTEFLNAKDNGVFSQQGKSVWGSTARYDGFAVETLEGIAKERKMDGTRRARFAQAVAGLRDSSMGSVMRFEQAQSKKVADAEFDITMEDSLNALSLCYDDDEACRAQIEIAIGANAAKYADFGGAVVSQNEQKLISKAQAFRTQAMLQQDPRKAQAFFSAHEKEILPEDRLKLKTAIDKQTDLLWTQETADGYMKKFSDEKAAIAHIRKNYEGEKEDKLVTAVKMRFNEREIKNAQADASSRKAQQKIFDDLYINYYSQNKVPPAGTERQLLDSRQLSPALYERTMAYRSGLGNYATLRKQLSAQEGFDDMPPQQQESAVLKLAGTTESEHKEWLAKATDGMRSGAWSKADIDQAANECKITKSEALQIKTEMERASKEQSGYVRTKKAKLQKLMRDSQLDPLYAGELFESALAELDPKDPKYREKVLEASKEAAVTVITESGKKLSSWMFWRSSAGKLLDKVQATKPGKTDASSSRQFPWEKTDDVSPEDKRKSELDALLGQDF